jgi:hypothetical protein
VFLRSSEGFNPAGVPDIPVWLSDRSDPRQAVAGWETVVGAPVSVYDIPGHHFEPFNSQNVSPLIYRSDSENRLLTSYLLPDCKRVTSDRRGLCAFRAAVRIKLSFGYGVYFLHFVFSETFWCRCMFKGRFIIIIIHSLFVSWPAIISYHMYFTALSDLLNIRSFRLSPLALGRAEMYAAIVNPCTGRKPSSRGAEMVIDFISGSGTLFSVRLIELPPHITTLLQLVLGAELFGSRFCQPSLKVLPSAMAIARWHNWRGKTLEFCPQH